MLRVVERTAREREREKRNLNNITKFNEVLNKIAQLGISHVLRIDNFEIIPVELDLIFIELSTFQR